MHTNETKANNLKSKVLSSLPLRSSRLLRELNVEKFKSIAIALNARYDVSLIWFGGKARSKGDNQKVLNPLVLDFICVPPPVSVFNLLF